MPPKSQKCPDCKGKGKIELFQTWEDPCKTCGGVGRLRAQGGVNSLRIPFLEQDLDYRAGMAKAFLHVKPDIRDCMVPGKIEALYKMIEARNYQVTHLLVAGPWKDLYSSKFWPFPFTGSLWGAKVLFAQVHDRTMLVVALTAENPLARAVLSYPTY